MNYTQRDDKHDKKLDEESGAPSEGSEGASKHKLPFLPASDDDSPLGSTDQHSDA